MSLFPNVTNSSPCIRVFCCCLVRTISLKGGTFGSSQHWWYSTTPFFDIHLIAHSTKALHACDDQPASYNCYVHDTWPTCMMTALLDIKSCPSFVYLQKHQFLCQVSIGTVPAMLWRQDQHWMVHHSLTSFSWVTATVCTFVHWTCYSVVKKIILAFPLNVYIITWV